MKTVDSLSLSVILAIFQRLEQEKFYGTIEVTLTAGEYKYDRKLQSCQDFEAVIEHWELLPELARKQAVIKFGKNAKFLELMKQKCYSI
jgi:hypothetical protein